MSQQVTEPIRIAEDRNVRQMIARVQRQVGKQVRDLRIVSHPDGIILQGRVRSYYSKQLVQHAAMQISGRSIVTNEIEVE